MRKRIIKVLILILFVLFAGISIFVISKNSKTSAQTTSSSPHWPSARTAGWNLGLDGLALSDKEVIYEWAARHYDFIQSLDGRLLDYVRERNPTIEGLGRYAIFTTVIHGTLLQQKLEDRALVLGRGVEDAYLHYNIDKSPHSARATYNVSEYFPWLRTEYDSVGGNWKVFVPGWDSANDRDGSGYVEDDEFPLVNSNATAREKKYARTVEWSWGPPPNGPQWQVNPGVFDIAKVLVEAREADIDKPVTEYGQSAGYTALWWDALGWLYTGDKLEYDSLDQWLTDAAALVRYSKELFGDRVLIGGGGQYWTLANEMDFIIDEASFNTWNTARDWEGLRPGGTYGQLNPNSGYYRAREAGKIHLLQHQYNLGIYLEGKTDPFQWSEEVFARDRIFGVVAYYLLQNPGKDYWHAYRGFGYWPTLEINQKFWSRALEVDIGLPTDQAPAGKTPITYWGVWVFAEGADPGHPNYPDINLSRYKIYAREYSKGLVLLKPKSGNDSNLSTFLDNTATTHTLPGTYFKVKDDGTIDSTPITSITLRNGEAAILVEEGVGISKQVDKTSAASGETLTYTINYSNNTAGEVTNAKIEDPIPLGTTFVSAVNGGTSDGSKVIWNLGTIVAGESGTVTFQVRIN